MRKYEVMMVDRLFKELVEEEKKNFKKNFNIDLSDRKATRVLADRIMKDKKERFIL